jgi:uncharacterized protein YqgC (DUF456 family)
MNTITQVKLVIVFVALVIWAYGYRSNNRTLMWLGMGLVVVAFLLRFAPQQRR